MGLRNFLDDIIPNELKKINLGKAAAIAGSAYLGYKYGPTVYNTLKGFVGRPEQLNMPFDQKAPATGMFKLAETFKKYSDNPLVKFGKGLTGTTLNKDGTESKQESDEYLAQLQAINERYTSNRYSQIGTNVGNFTSTASTAGFNNNRVRESLINMSAYMNDLADNGRIDSSALYAEGPKGTTIKVGSSALKTLRI